MKKLLYINVPWMNCYEGAIKGVDEPKGFFGYTLKKPMNDHCQFNFKKFAGRVYGHVPGSTNPNLTRLGGSRSDDSVNGVTVVWIATHPDSGGRVIVGWYKNAPYGDGGRVQKASLPGNERFGKVAIAASFRWRPTLGRQPNVSFAANGHR